MTIPTSELWISKSGRRAVPLAESINTPDEFESMDHVNVFLNETYDDGTYTVLRKETIVTVDRQQDKMFENYTDEAIESIYDIHDEICETIPNLVYCWVIDDAEKYGHALTRKNGVDIRARPHQYDLAVKVRLENDGLEDVVSQVAETAENFQVIGWKRRPYYERRGARPEPAVEMYFKYVTPRIEQVRAYVSEDDFTVDIVDADIITYSPLLFKQGTDSKGDVVVLTNVEVDVIDGIQEVDEAPEILQESYSDYATEFEQTVEQETDWTVTSIGSVVSTESSTMAFLAIGLSDSTE